jgi:hypothetical protein
MSRRWFRERRHIMKTYKYIFIISILFLLPAYSHASDLGYIHISLIQGDVQIKTDETLDWVAASINMPIKEGDRIWVPEAGRLEIRLRDGTCVRLDQNSGIELLTVGDSNQFYLSFGRAYVNFRGQDNALLQVDTPLSAVRVYDTSKFNIDVSDTGYTELSVITGAVHAESRSGQTRVGAGKTLSIGEDLYAELSPLGQSDEWESWNRDRDNSQYAQRDSSQYLPTELRAYSSDFDSYGRWVNTTDYGYVWTPTFSISVGWSPYSYGRWVWIGGDYVWISYQPWGWAPYHYGRWNWNVSIGWCWIPPVLGSVYWGPGYVGWYYTPTYVAWVPLGPRDTYYGYGYYGPHSATLVIPRHFKTPIHYQNAHVHNSVMSVSRNTFLRGTYSRMSLKENPFQKGVYTAGRPQITPELATKRPRMKDVPLAKQPPQMVRNLNTKELKNSRPLVQGRDNSVLRPETHPQKMTVKTVQKPSRLLAKGTTGQGTLIQKQGPTPGKQQGLIGRTDNTPGKQGALQRPFTDRQTNEMKKSPAAPAMQQPAGRYGGTQNPQQVNRGKQPDTKTTSPFDRYQPYSKQKGSDAYVAKQYTRTSEPVVKREIKKASDFNRSPSSLQGTQKQEPRKIYTSPGSSRSTKSRQQGSDARITQRQSSVSYKAVTPPKREPQGTYVSAGNKSTQKTQYNKGDVYRGSTVNRGSSGLGLTQQPQATFSRGSSGTPSMGPSRSPAMNFRK